MVEKGHLPLVSILFVTACHYQSVHPLELPPLENVSRHIFLTWPFPIDTDKQPVYLHSLLATPLP